jgi:hypothetical protein
MLHGRATVKYPRRRLYLPCRRVEKHGGIVNVLLVESKALFKNSAGVLNGGNASRQHRDGFCFAFIGEIRVSTV